MEDVEGLQRLLSLSGPSSARLPLLSANAASGTAAPSTVSSAETRDESL